MSLSGRSPHAPSRRAPKRPSALSLASRPRQLSVCVRCASLATGERLAVDTSTSNVLKIASGGKDLQFSTDGLSFFGQQSTTEELYTQMVRDLVPTIIAGVHATVFTFGAHHTGKTRTLIGTQASPGLVALAVNDLFKHIQRLKLLGVVVTTQFFELRHEIIHDLLSPGQESEIELREHPATGLTLFGLTRVRLESPEEVWKVLERGNSRKDSSHMMFQLTLHQPQTPSKRATKISFFDLAGFLKAENETDKGLRAVRNVIKALTSSPGLFVPFRDSKLTRILKDSLNGKSNTVLLACISASESQFEETQDTLRLVQRARGLILDPGQSESAFVFPLREYDGTLTLLRAELQEWKPLDFLDLKVDDQSRGSANLLGGQFATMGSRGSPSSARTAAEMQRNATLPRNFHAPTHAPPTRPNSNSLVTSPPPPPPSSSSAASSLALTTTSHSCSFSPLSTSAPSSPTSGPSSPFSITSPVHVATTTITTAAEDNSNDKRAPRSPSPGFFRDPRNRSVLEQHLSTKLTHRIVSNFQERIQVHRSLMELSNLRKSNIRLMAQSHGATRTKGGSVVERAATIANPQQADVVIRQNEKTRESLQVELKRLEKEAQTLLAQATETSHLKQERHQLVRQTLERCSLELQNTEYELMLSSLGRTLADKQQEIQIKDEELEKKEYELEQKDNEIKMLRIQLLSRGETPLSLPLSLHSEHSPSFSSSYSNSNHNNPNNNREEYPPPPSTPTSPTNADAMFHTRGRRLSSSPSRVNRQINLDLPKNIEASENSVSRGSENYEDDCGRPRAQQRSIDEKNNTNTSGGSTGNNNNNDDIQQVDDFLKEGNVAPWYTDHEGWLAKKSTAKILGFGAKWQKRFFVLKLDQLCLSYFKSETDVIPLGIIPLHNCLFVQALSARQFVLCLENRVYELKAEDNQRCNEWLGHLDMCIRDFLTSPRRGGAIVSALSQAALTMEARELMFGRSTEHKRRLTPQFPSHLKSLLPSLKTSDMGCTHFQSHFFRVLCYHSGAMQNNLSWCLSDSSFLLKLHKLWPSDHAVFSTLLNVLVNHSFELPLLPLPSASSSVELGSVAYNMARDIKEVQLSPSLTSSLSTVISSSISCIESISLRERIYIWVRDPSFYAAIDDECMQLEPLALTLTWAISQFRAHMFDDSPLFGDERSKKEIEINSSSGGGVLGEKHPRSKLGALFSTKAKLLDITSPANSTSSNGAVGASSGNNGNNSSNNGSSVSGGGSSSGSSSTQQSHENSPRASGENKDAVDVIEGYFSHVFNPFFSSSPSISSANGPKEMSPIEMRMRESLNLGKDVSMSSPSSSSSPSTFYYRRRPSKVLNEETDMIKKTFHWKYKYIDECSCCRQGQIEFHERIIRICAGSKFTQKVCDSLLTLLTTSVAFWAGEAGLSAFNKPIHNLGVVRTLLACVLDSDPHLRAYSLRELNGLLMPNPANVDAIMQISQWQLLLIPLLRDITPELLTKSRIWEKVFNYVLAAFATIHFHSFLFSSRLHFPSVLMESFSFVDDLLLSAEVRIAFARGLLASLVTKLAAAYASKRFETATMWDLILFVVLMVKYYVFCMPVATERDENGLLHGLPGLHEAGQLREDMALVEKTLQLLRVLKIWSPVDVGGLLDLPNKEKEKLVEFVEKHQRVDLSHPVFKPNAADLQSVTQNAAPAQQKCLKLLFEQMQFLKDSMSFLAMVRAKNLGPQIPETQFQNLVYEFLTRKARERLSVFHIATITTVDFSK